VSGGRLQVAVAVVDRAGVTQVLLRDRFAGPHTVEVATNKAWTAVTFRQDTAGLNQASQPGQPGAPLRHFPRVIVMGGGVPFEASLGGHLHVVATGESKDKVAAQAAI
jgi:uncharacterized protein GlcG (DUF336 family)